MNKKLLILIFALFLIVIPLTFAFYPYTNYGDNFVATGDETFTGATPLINYSGGCEALDGWLSCDDVDSRYVHELIDVDKQGGNNYTIFQGYISASSSMLADRNFLSFCGTNVTGSTECFGMIRFTADVIKLVRIWDGTAITLTGWKPDGTSQFLQVVYGKYAGDYYMTVFLNGTELAKLEHDKDGDESVAVSVKYMIWGHYDPLDGIDGISNTSEWVSFNGSVYLGGPLEFTTTATDLYDGGAISNFTVILSNATDTLINTTTTGQINWENLTAGVYDVTFTSDQAGGYFNVSFDDVDVSSDLAAEMFQSVLILNATDLTDESQIIDFAVTVPLQINHSNSSGQAILLLKAGEYTVIGNESNHLNVSKTISVAALETKFETMEFGSKHLHINATDIITGATISTFDVVLEDINTDFASNISTTSGEATFSLEIGNFTITVSATDYVTLIENVTVDSIHTNHTSQLQKRNSILINIFAEGNLTVLNQTNVTADFDSDTSVFSSMSANGTIYLEDVTPEDYTITFSALDFDSRDYFINLISGSNVNLNVYLIGSGESTEITFTIVDASTSINLDGVLVSVAKKINLSFLTIAQEESDISGVVIFDLDQDIEYRFTLSKTEFETRTFDLTPTSETYTIELTPESVIDYTTIYDRIDFTLLPLNTTLRTGSIIDFSIIAASLGGTVIDYFGVNSTFNSTDFITNISTSAAGGTATIQLNFDSFIGSVGVTYFIDIDGFDPVRVNRNFYVSNVTASNVSITSVIDLFDDQLGTSKQGMLLKAIIAVAFIIIIMATIASMGVRDRRLNIVAASGLGFFMIFGWVPTGITIAIMIILFGSFFIGGLKGGTD